MNRELLMRRCLDLARLGHFSNGTNPCVGSLLFGDNEIKAEGYYQKFGGPHAEANCLAHLQDQPADPNDELFVSLEPCNIHGKTPPCRDLIIRHQIKSVSVSTTDPNPQIAGSSLHQISTHGITCRSGLHEKMGRRLLRSFQRSITKSRPYLILKWAQSRDGFIGRKNERIKISGGIADRLVHSWRAASDGIMVGTKTALIDNPRLDNRLFLGPSPTRIVLDREALIPLSHHLLDDLEPTIVLGRERSDRAFVRTSFIPYQDPSQFPKALKELYNKGMGNILIEGGGELLNYCLKNELWDECRVIVSDQYLDHGIAAPDFDHKCSSSIRFGNDHVLNFLN